MDYCAICRGKNRETKFRIPNPKYAHRIHQFYKWLDVINNPVYWTLPKEKAAGIRVCQLHFKADDIITDLNRISLKYDAVPLGNVSDANVDEPCTSIVAHKEKADEPSILNVVNLEELGISTLEKFEDADKPSVSKITDLGVPTLDAPSTFNLAQRGGKYLYFL